MQNKIRWGILGPGIIARQFASSLQELPDAELAAVGSRDYERSKDFCDVFAGKPYGSYTELVNDPNVDIIYVATPHNFHEEHVLLCVNAGKNVLCEKPFAINAAQAERMYAAAKKNNVFILDGLWSRYFPAWEYAADLAKSGDMGKVLAVNAATCWGRPTVLDAELAKNRLFDINLAGGALLDAGVYSLASASVIIGSEYPKKINAMTKMTSTGVDDYDLIAMEYESGPICSLICGLSGRLHETNIVLERGTITIPGHRNPDTVIVSRLTRDWRRNVKEIHSFYYRAEGFQFEVGHVHDCLKKGLKTSPRATPEESLTLMRICDEVRRQANFVYPFE
ncbi:oxidoreductase [Spirochaetia bacterium]|nr:oxidoreductase [Spirochaetia bacterium]